MDPQVTSVLAIYGAVCSTLSISIALFLAWRDRSRLRVWVLPTVEHMPMFFNRDCKYATGGIANVGRRSINIVGASLGVIERGKLHYQRPTFRVADDGAPVEISPHVFPMPPVHEGQPLFMLFEFDGEDPVTLYEFVVQDARGKVHRGYAPGAFANSARLAFHRLGVPVTFPPTPLAQNPARLSEASAAPEP